VSPSEPRRAKIVGWRKQDGIRLAVLAWILGCWWVGAQRSGGSLEPFLNAAWPQAAHFEDLGDDTFRA